MTTERCESSTTGTHEWRAFLSGGYKCVYCGQEWLPAEPCIDPDEIGGKDRPWEPEPLWRATALERLFCGGKDHPWEPEPLWPKLIGVIVAIVFVAVVFGTVGVK
jgi:hypothetical protein